MVIIKKIGFLCLVCILLTGCDVTYNLHVSSANNSETFEIVGPNSNLSSDGLINEMNMKYGNTYNIEPLVDYYDCEQTNCTKTDLINPFGFLAVRIIPSIAAYNRNTIFTEYFGSVSITGNNGVYTLAAKPTIKLKSLLTGVGASSSSVNKLTINITSEHEVTDFNGTKTDDGVYKWVYTKDNTDKEIRFTYKVEKAEEEVVKKDTSKRDSIVSTVIFIILGAIAIIVAVFMYKKASENDKV